jgi:hypothetical protein
MIRTAFAIGLFALAASSSMAAAQDIAFVEHAGDVQTIDNAPQGDSVGDYLSFSGAIFDADNKSKVGTDSGFCMRTIKAARYECSWTVSLAAGQIMIAGPFLDSGDSTLAVVGGTGKFEGARGEMLLHARDTKGAEYDFKFKLK